MQSSMSRRRRPRDLTTTDQAMPYPSDAKQPGLRRARVQPFVRVAHRKQRRGLLELLPAVEVYRARERIEEPRLAERGAVLPVAPPVVEHIRDRVPDLPR